MNDRRPRDTRDEVDSIVHRYQLEYSLAQLRLVGLLLNWLQGRRQMRRLGLTPALFFRTDTTGPVQQHRRRATD